MEEPDEEALYQKEVVRQFMRGTADNITVVGTGEFQERCRIDCLREIF